MADETPAKAEPKTKTAKDAKTAAAVEIKFPSGNVYRDNH